MWGLFFIVFFCIGAFIHSCKNDIENIKSKQNAINNNQNYYLDWQGSKRRVNNNHKVLQHVTDYRTGDKVDLDMKTNEVLRNYSQEERVNQFNKEQEWAEEGKKNKEKAIEKGDYFYSVRVYDPNNRITYNKYVWKRVSDDLLLDTVYISNFGYQLFGKEAYRGRAICVDAKYKFRLYEVLERARTNKEFIAQNDKHNRWLCKYLVEENKVNMTEKELFEYAKNLGAIFIGEEETNE